MRVIDIDPGRMETVLKFYDDGKLVTEKYCKNMSFQEQAFYIKKLFDDLDLDHVTIEVTGMGIGLSPISNDERRKEI